MAHTEFAAERARHKEAGRARWATVLAPAAKTIIQRSAVRKNPIARLLGL